MSVDDLTTAADCYQRLQEVAQRLEALHAAGRLRMATDAENTTWTDTGAGVQAALAALDVAVQATAWMETVPAALSEVDSQADDDEDGVW